MFINGSLGFYEDAQPGGFDNPNGSVTPPFARGVGAAMYWLRSLAIALALAGLGLYVQFR
jgi:hypothetical protein